MDKSYDALSFVDFDKKLLAYLDRDEIRNAYLVLDNVPFHHSISVSKLIQSRGHETVYLPPYSCFLNKIVNLFSQFKYYVKRFEPKTFNGVFEACTCIRSNIRKLLL